MAYFDLHIADFRTEHGSRDLFEQVVAAAHAATLDATQELSRR